MKSISLSAGVATLSTLLLTGCALGPDRPPPSVAVPAAWKEPDRTSAIVTAAISAEWWQLFRDTELNRIEIQVIAANQDLQRATARVAEARALSRVSAADRSPQLSAGAGYSHERRSENRPGLPGQKLEGDDQSMGLDLSYELDAFGRVRHQNDAARAEAAATENDRDTVHNAVTTEAAGNYFQLRSLDAEKVVLEATLNSRRDTVQLLQTRHAAGLINEVDITRARVEAANVEAELHALTGSRSRLEHALAVLCGEAPAGFAIVQRPWDATLPAIPAGLPASLLLRRPDLAAADQRVQAAAARISVAKADFFPRIALTAVGGLASAELGSLLNAGSRTWSFGPSLYLPLFNGGRNRAQLNAAEARFEQSAAAYRGTVLGAFREVEDTLSDLATLSSQSDAVDRALASARETADLASQRYRQGLTSFLEVVDAERAALQAERRAAQLRGQRTAATLLLIKAVGGGWERSTTLASR